jgi:hypothetical protein
VYVNREEVLAMSVRSALYMPAFVIMAVALLIVVAGCGAIVALLYCGHRSRFSYFAGGIATKITDEEDIAPGLVSVV